MKRERERENEETESNHLTNESRGCFYFPLLALQRQTPPPPAYGNSNTPHCLRPVFITDILEAGINRPYKQQNRKTKRTPWLLVGEFSTSVCG
jgi:hypothetical protein